ETVDPVSGRIGDASGAFAHFFSSGVPVRVSNVPRPVLILFESGTGPDSASLKLGPVGRGGAAAAWQTLARTSDVLAIPSLRVAVIWLGLPHQAALSVAYLSIFDCAATNALNSWHASFGEALRSPGGVVHPPLSFLSLLT